MESTLKVAAITTIYYAHSHADAIVTKFMKGTSTDEGFFPPEVELVSLYIDHVLENDIGVELAREHGVPVYPSIRRALHAGGLELRVDAVLLIGEHGDYPWNERGRHMYPRRYFFEQIAGVFAESGRSVPVYNDKHFAYDFQDALWMWNRARELEIPLMAGSCLPVAWRKPWLEYEKGTPVEEALSIGYSSAAAVATHPRKGMPLAHSPISAITTTVPAKRTALPAVVIALAMASSNESPAAVPSRNLVVINRA